MFFEAAAGALILGFRLFGLCPWTPETGPVLVGLLRTRFAYTPLAFAP
jgi:hypothetical protein